MTDETPLFTAHRLLMDPTMASTRNEHAPVTQVRCHFPSPISALFDLCNRRCISRPKRVNECGETSRGQPDRYRASLSVVAHCYSCHLSRNWLPSAIAVRLYLPDRIVFLSGDDTTLDIVYVGLVTSEVPSNARQRRDPG